MNINKVNNISFGTNNKPQQKRVKTYTKQQALDALLDEYRRVDNSIKLYNKECDEYLDSIPESEFEKKASPEIDNWLRYFPIIRETEIKKAYIEDAMSKISKLPDTPNLRFQLKLGR